MIIKYRWLGLILLSLLGYSNCSQVDFNMASTETEFASKADLCDSGFFYDSETLTCVPLTCLDSAEPLDCEVSGIKGLRFCENRHWGKCEYLAISAEGSARSVNVKSGVDYKVLVQKSLGLVYQKSSSSFTLSQGSCSKSSEQSPWLMKSNFPIAVGKNIWSVSDANQEVMKSCVWTGQVKAQKIIDGQVKQTFMAELTIIPPKATYNPPIVKSCDVNAPKNNVETRSCADYGMSGIYIKSTVYTCDETEWLWKSTVSDNHSAACSAVTSTTVAPPTITTTTTTTMPPKNPICESEKETLACSAQFGASYTGNFMKIWQRQWDVETKACVRVSSTDDSVSACGRQCDPSARPVDATEQKNCSDYSAENQVGVAIVTHTSSCNMNNFNWEAQDSVDLSSCQPAKCADGSFKKDGVCSRCQEVTANPCDMKLMSCTYQGKQVCIINSRTGVRTCNTSSYGAQFQQTQGVADAICRAKYGSQAVGRINSMNKWKSPGDNYQIGWNGSEFYYYGASSGDKNGITSITCWSDVSCQAGYGNSNIAIDPLYNSEDLQSPN